MRRINTIIKIEKLSNELQGRVRDREDGLFRNTFIVDGHDAYGYGCDGTAHVLDANMVRKASRFIWHKNESGYIVTDNVQDASGRRMEMGEMVMGLWPV